MDLGSGILGLAGSLGVDRRLLASGTPRVLLGSRTLAQQLARLVLDPRSLAVLNAPRSLGMTMVVGRAARDRPFCRAPAPDTPLSTSFRRSRASLARDDRATSLSADALRSRGMIRTPPIDRARLHCARRPSTRSADRRCGRRAGAGRAFRWNGRGGRGRHG